ncbi:GAF domain-like protein [Armillaria fumosa]|nr:GAF domain-like protein [Armillaria fumosa]
MAQINEQLGNPPDLETFLRVVVGIIKDLTQFHRVLVYQFDERWNGQVVAELVDWEMTHDLYKGLHFPAGDIPAPARQLYMTNKVRILYDRDQATARIVSTDLGNMGVRASMSVSIMAFGTLWGLVACHSYAPVECAYHCPLGRYSNFSASPYTEISNGSATLKDYIRGNLGVNHPTGYIVSDVDSLLSLFDADFGILVIGDGAKILGANANERGQEILIVAEYLRLK